MGSGVTTGTGLDVPRIQSLMPIETEQSFGVGETILYALGVGAGVTDDDQMPDLRFLYELELSALPTMAVSLAYPGFWMQRPEFGIDWRQVLHIDQLVTLHTPLPVEGHVKGVMTLESVHDRGADNGVLLRVRREISDATSGAALATVVQGSLLRGNGGFAQRGEGGKRWADPPERQPDGSLALGTRPEQALLYRLLGDDNPLHIDPEVARAAGFDRPLLHGLCTFGVAGRAVLRLLCGDDPAALESIGARFTSPVYPGETILTEVWRTGSDSGMFRCLVQERGIVALDCGIVRFR